MMKRTQNTQSPATRAEWAERDAINAFAYVRKYDATVQDCLRPYKPTDEGVKYRDRRSAPLEAA